MCVGICRCISIYTYMYVYVRINIGTTWICTYVHTYVHIPFAALASVLTLKRMSTYPKLSQRGSDPHCSK